ncbi:MAG: hypothetical protein KDB65_07980 [Calditrichaeota bacterium]|nr:hypothetical protein [Calditrichota bacterium]MCB9367489.1 hypothetical protein [Calditrichota bacterium]
MSQSIVGNNFEHLAILLSHPQVNYLELAQALADSVDSKHATRHIRAFLKEIESFSITDIQELYSKTFDLNPVASPALSVHLFGVESFKRSHLMVGLLDMYRETSYVSTGESADHMSTVIGFLPCASVVDRKELSTYVVLPGLMKMAEFLASKNSPFAHLLKAACEIVETEAGKEAVYA